jgi:hypothetical protein
MGTACAVLADGQPAHKAALAALGDTLAQAPRASARVAAAREELRGCAGDEAVADAVATAAFFAFMTRVVDTSGHTNPMMELSRRAPSKGKLLAGAALLAALAAGVALMRGAQ